MSLLSEQTPLFQQQCRVQKAIDLRQQTICRYLEKCIEHALLDLTMQLCSTSFSQWEQRSVTLQHATQF